MIKRFLYPKIGIFALIFMLTFSIGFQPEKKNDDYFEIAKNLDIFAKLYREIHTHYVDEVEPTEFIRTGINAMLSTLDPYTNYIAPGEVEDFLFVRTGQYGGIGATVGDVHGKVTFTELYEGFPAAESGLLVGDVIESIDGQKVTVADIPKLRIRSLLRGLPKSEVKLTIIRDGQKKNVTLKRGEIRIKNVPYFGMADEKTGYIKLTGFTKNASKEVKTAIKKLKEENSTLEALILDVRGNPGGLLFEAIEIANLFVAKGEKIVETKGRIEGSYRLYTAQNEAVDTKIPLAVLIDDHSASASEIVSGVIQDLDRGVIVGQGSFGKGLVQTTRPLSYNAQVKITTAKYYTPSGRCIQAIDYSTKNNDKVPDSLKKAFNTKAGRIVYDGGGIQPDIAVEKDQLHTITQELIKQDMIFDFCTKFQKEHESIEKPQEFKVTDKLYNEFVAFLKGKNFVYNTKSEEKLLELKSMMKSEKYDVEASDELKKLEQKLESRKKNDLTKFKKEISNALRVEIVKRYYYEDGEIESSFKNDDEVKKAIEILSNSKKYKEILKIQ